MRIHPKIVAFIAMIVIGFAENVASGRGSQIMRSTTLIESCRPHGDVLVLLEDDERTVYLYLHFGGEEDAVFPVWVANRVAAPPVFEEEPMNDGEAPLNPVEYCAHPEGMGPLDPNRLEVVWLPEGDGVAVYEKGTLLAAISGWAGEEELIGYAREARGQGPLAWELTKDAPMHGRFAAARQYWRSWSRKPDPWQRIQREQLGALEKRFGKHRRYFSIDGGKWPPKAVVQIRTKDANLWVTVGMAVRPMSAAERNVKDARLFRRIELGIVLPLDADENLVETIGDYVSWQTSLPWGYGTWLGHGHTIPSCRELVAVGYPAVGLLAALESNYPIELPAFDGEPVTLLWMVPLSADEYARAKAEGIDAVLSAVILPRSFDTEKMTN